VKWKKRLREIEGLRAKHRGSRFKNAFPDLRVESGAPACSNAFFPVIPRRKGPPPGAREFPVGHSHKQGMQLITPAQLETELQYLGGKKA
jgi:hypothetical protein